jgi:hypothetical protein
VKGKRERNCFDVTIVTQKAKDLILVEIQGKIAEGHHVRLSAKHGILLIGLAEVLDSHWSIRFFSQRFHFFSFHIFIDFIVHAFLAAVFALSSGAATPILRSQEEVQRLWRAVFSWKHIVQVPRQNRIKHHIYQHPSQIHRWSRNLSKKKKDDEKKKIEMK